ncbi:type II toxin-antitoxin system RelE/ParE family toxin [Candidatus Peregrinibacteria bacterium]|jgi:toxin HigB-1|nr:type II toxin-antitoxin system RelE/ParE family toxin [Candidatus Peregrinibacteria bacterium]MBT4631618.1 type II toxin-antitoxin system RelE/ParE family toxin [Candidatus Peregrinibacteria bacterium]MBT5516746.1 type II toxin-antitoxin system RelE/ParE family toxin [Candidatus Peregrinibacteria bacterium]MBT5823972.1 type II toxin-antitoxin system RelE/ParE family toxin [Candidatus Peregrinibacteria bacterium]
MIKTFNCKETEKIFNRNFSRKLPTSIQRTSLKKLNIIHAATSINDLRIPPSNHLERLKGSRKNQHSIKINKQWRICFKWKENDAYELEITDYH